MTLALASPVRFIAKAEPVRFSRLLNTSAGRIAAIGDTGRKAHGDAGQGCCVAQGVDAAAAIEDVRAGAALQSVIARAADQGVVACAA